MVLLMKLTLPFIITYFSMLAWIFPPFKQYRTNYFLFFIVLAISEPINTLLFFLQIHFKPYLVMILILYYSLLPKTGRTKIFLSIAFLLSIPAAICLSQNYQVIIYIILFLGIFLIIIQEFMLYIEKYKALNLFYMLLITYILSLIYKMIAGVLDLIHGMVIFYLTSFLEVLFGIFFTFINIKTRDFRLFKKMES
jgi:hypothetical protein